MRYVNYNSKSGEIIGFYHSRIHKKIPEPLIELTEEEYRAVIAVHGKYRINVKSQTLEEIPPPSDDVLLENARIEKCQVLERHYDFESALPFVSNALGEPHKYSSAPLTVAVLNYLIETREDSVYMYYDDNNVPALALHTVAQLRQVLDDSMQTQKTRRAVFIDKINLVKSATTIAEVNAVVS